MTPRDGNSRLPKKAATNPETRTGPRDTPSISPRDAIASPKPSHFPNFGAQLKAARLAVNVTKPLLAKAIGVPAATVAALEAGTSEPTWRALDLLAEATGATVAYLLAELPAEGGAP